MSLPAAVYTFLCRALYSRMSLSRDQTTAATARKRKWGALVRSAVLAAALAWSLEALAQADPAAAAIRVRTHIEPQDLGSALRKFAADRHLQILYTTDTVANRTTGGAVGEFTVDEALDRLLGGTGLAFRYVDESTITIVPIASGRRNSNPPTIGNSTSGAHAGPADLEEARKSAGFWERFHLAQLDQQPRGGSVGRPLVIEEVVVTAEKRAENLQDVASSVSSLGGEKLEALHATQLSDYAAHVPGLAVSDGGSPGSSRVILRGLSVGGDVSTVGIYVDDAPFGSSSGFLRGATHTLDVLPYDLERVEVLRGPQGTLYGANTMGGLIKYMTRKPDMNAWQARMGGEMSSVHGSDDLSWAMRASVNAPLVEDKLAVRASFFNTESAGYIDNARLGLNDVNSVTQRGGRASLAWQATQDLSITLSALIENIDADENAIVSLDPTGLASVGAALANENFIREAAQQRIRYYTAQLDWQLDAASLRSISSYSTSSIEERADTTRLFGVAFPVLGPRLGLGPLDTGVSLQHVELDLTKFTQELRLASPAGQRWEWLLGTFYTHEQAENGQLVRSLTTSGAPIPGLDPFAVAFLPTSYEEVAAFGNVLYRFSGRFDVGFGLRVTRNEQEYRQIASGIPLIASGDFAARSDENVTNFAVSPRYHVSEDVMLYARVASGYRPGGPNVVDAELPAAYRADEIVSYETGVKAQFLQRRAQLNAAVFLIDWQDVQVSRVGQAVNGLANGGRARSQGIEISAVYLPVAMLQLELNGAYTKAELRDAIELAPLLPPAGLPGDQLPDTPRWSGSLRLDYERPLSSSAAFSTAAAYRYVGERYSSTQSDPKALLLPSYRLVDLHAGIATDRWNVRLFAKNVTDERAYSSWTRLDDVLGNFNQIRAVVLQPRTVGLSVDVSF